MTDLKMPNCINCGSRHVYHDAAFGFYKCESCSTMWNEKDNYPDYKRDDFEYDADTDRSAGWCQMAREKPKKLSLMSQRDSLAKRGRYPT